MRAAVTAGKISFVCRWIAGLTVLAIAIVATAVVVLWRRVYDPRQYPDSGHVTLSSVLEWADLTLPECGERGVRYWYFGNFFGEADMLMRMSASRGCVEQFLSVNAAEPIAAGDRPPVFVTGTPGAWGWPDGRLLRGYSVAAGSDASVMVEIAADLDATPLADLFVHVSDR
ncbi:hypothetical protein [Dactylosporangium sp. NPDC005555]|uniref:hypothetical protein n=1 Tax=Dactylosporangium sp. NPDC005555 TaxID=3154889 RepID=UPI0033A7CCBD